MFLCLNCSKEFTEPVKRMEDGSERFGEKWSEEVALCPYCLSCDFEEGNVCDICGRFFSEPDDVVATDNGRCVCLSGCIEKACTKDASIEYIRENDFMEEFAAFILHPSEIEHMIRAEQGSIVIKDIWAKAREFCLDDKIHFAKKAL